jgi:hypothetical protein
MKTYRFLLRAGAVLVGLISTGAAAIFLRPSISIDSSATYTQMGTADDTASPVWPCWTPCARTDCLVPDGVR